MRVNALEFAAQRSHDTAIAANENSRPMAQYALLINGAAATAIIAYLSKEKIDPEVLSMAPFSLVAYAAGVVVAVIGMFCMTESLDCYSNTWRFRALATGDAERQRVLGDRYWLAVRMAVFFSIICFAAGSGVFAYGLMHRAAIPVWPCD